MALSLDQAATNRIKRTILSKQVRDVLLDEITAGRFPVGAKLHSVHELARTFRVSTSPVREAIAELETRGYVVSRHGSGTYVTANHVPLTVTDSVMLCIEAKAHLFGDLGAALMGRLLKQGLLPGVVDIGFMDDRSPLLHRALASDARFFVVHGKRFFDFEALQRAALPDRHIVGVVDWETNLEIPRVRRILSDYPEGGRLVARHLHARGHRRVLLLGTDVMITDISGGEPFHRRQGWGFAEAWRELGGTWQGLYSDMVPNSAEITLDPDRLLGCFRKADAPTAIFGLRDVEAWHAQTLLLKHAPDLAASVEIVGYGNTPWSLAGHPPFTTVDLDVEQMAEETARKIGALRAEEDVEPAAPTMIQPKLVIRGSQ